MGNYDRKKPTSACANGCMQAVKWIPVIFITAVIAWSYYAYVVQLCIFAVENIFEKIVFLVFYHMVGVLFLWSYWNTIFTPVGTVPASWRISEQDIDRLFRADNQEQQKRILENCAREFPVSNRALNGSVRFCEKCKIIKPDRAHHCSVCGVCVLKMDHHCPWVNNCVNFSNYKYFVLFLGYALLYCLFVALSSLEYVVRFWRGELNSGMGRFHILFLFFVALMFAISLVSLFGYHIYLTVMNRTTLEAFRAPIFRIGGPDKNGFNLGKLANFQEVFGDNWKLWFLPVYTSLGDGLQYPTRLHQLQQNQPAHLISNTYNSMGDTQARLATGARSGGGNDALIAINNELLNDANNLESGMLNSPSPYASNHAHNHHPYHNNITHNENDVGEVNNEEDAIDLSIVDNRRSTYENRMSNSNDHHVIDIHSLKTHNRI